MPQYSYRCPTGHVSKADRPIAAHDDAPTCALCLLPTVRVLTAPAVASSGSGFYRNERHQK